MYFNLAVEYWVKEKVSFGSNVFVVSLNIKRRCKDGTSFVFLLLVYDV